MKKAPNKRKGYAEGTKYLTAQNTPDDYKSNTKRKSNEKSTFGSVLKDTGLAIVDSALSQWAPNVVKDSAYSNTGYGTTLAKGAVIHEGLDSASPQMKIEKKAGLVNDDETITTDDEIALREKSQNLGNTGASVAESYLLGKAVSGIKKNKKDDTGVDTVTLATNAESNFASDQERQDAGEFDREQTDILKGYSEGGKVKGAGTAKSDSIKASVKEGSTIIPAENSAIAEMLRLKYFGTPKKANLNQSGGEKINVSNGEEIFDPEETALLKSKGVDLSLLTPNADDSKSFKEGGEVTKEIDEALTNKNVVKYLNGLMYLEADKKDPINGKNPTSSARGQYQFIKSTRDSIKEKYGYDAWSQDPEEQHRAAIALIKDAGVLDSVKTGKFTDADKDLKEIWPSLPGGSQQTALVKSLEKVRASATAAGKGNDLKLAEAFDKWPKIQTAYTDAKKNPKNYTEAEVRKILTDYNSTKNLIIEAGKKKKEVSPFKEETDNSTTDNSLVSNSFNTKNVNTEVDEDYAQKLLGGKQITSSNGAAADNLLSFAGVSDAESSALAADLEKGALGDEQKKQVDKNANEENKANMSAENGLALAQSVMGLYNLNKTGKRPVDKIDPEFSSAVERSKADASFGLDPYTKQLLQDKNDTARIEAVNLAAQTAGADPGLANARARVATNDYATNLVKIAASDAEMRFAKQQYSDNMLGQKTNMKRRLFEDKLNAFNVDQEAGAGLLNSGITNFFTNRRNQRAIETNEKINNTENGNDAEALTRYMQYLIKSDTTTPVTL